MKKISGLLCLVFVVPLILAAPAMAAPDENAIHVVPAYQASNSDVTYAELTTACLGWGLSENPYPTYLPLATGAKTSYKIFTIMIGDDEFQGVSCNTYTQTYTWTSPTTMEVQQIYDAIWYLGDFGKTNARMDQGFAGTVVVNIHNYNIVTKTFSYYDAQFDLEGFQRFNHQSLKMTIEDSRLSPLGIGICNVLGNRDNM